MILRSIILIFVILTWGHIKEINSTLKALSHEETSN